MNELNRFLIVLVACVLIVLMAIVIFLVWTAPDDAINELQSVVDFLRDNNETAGQLIVTLGALTVIVLALLMIIVELAPEDEPKELRVEQAGGVARLVDRQQRAGAVVDERDLGALEELAVVELAAA